MRGAPSLLRGVGPKRGFPSWAATALLGEVLWGPPVASEPELSAQGMGVGRSLAQALCPKTSLYWPLREESVTLPPPQIQVHLLELNLWRRGGSGLALGPWALLL